MPANVDDINIHKCQFVNCRNSYYMRLSFSILLFFIFNAIHSQEYFLFIGTYTSGESKGIYVYSFNTSTGEAKEVSVAGAENPSYLAIEPGGRFLYSVNQHGGRTGEVSAFEFDKRSGQLRFLNKQSSGGIGPCYVAVDASGKWVMVGNYNGGNLSAIPVDSDGSLGTPAQVINHTGSSVNKQRQEKPHVHATVFSPDQEYLVVPDLGIDKVMSYRLDPSSSEPLTPAEQPFINTNPGSGPRHITFHPKRPYVYLMNELDGTVSVFSWSNGKMKTVQTIPSHPANYKEEKGSADIHVSPDGKFLYASNRGKANNLAIYSIHPSSGKLKIKGFQSTLGVSPRNFVIDPTGNYLLVANQHTGNIVIFKRNKNTGLLQPGPTQIKIPNPVCLKISPNPS